MIELALGVLVLVVVWCAVRWARAEQLALHEFIDLLEPVNRESRDAKPPRAAGLKHDRRR